MVKSIENGTQLPPFLVKCYEMVEDELTDALISWSQSHNSFIIWNVSKFSSELLPRYFKHSNFSSFIRQLNIYGFRKTDTDRWEFANERFLKGQKHLLKDITRRKHPQGLAQKKSILQAEEESPESEEDKRVALWKEVETLKTDKNSLMQELVKLRQHQQTSRSQMLVLREKLKGVEKSQQQMLSFLVMAMQNPAFFVQLLQPKENSWIMAETGKNDLNEITDDAEPVQSEGMIVRYQPPLDEVSEPLGTAAAPDSERPMELDLSFEEVRDLFRNIDFTPGPLDENLLSFENHHPLSLPDITDDGELMLEQLLLSSPFSEDNEAEIDAESCGYVEMQTDSLQPNDSDEPDGSKEESGKCQDGVENTSFEVVLDSCVNMDILTEQLGHLNSVSSPNC